MQTDFTIPEKLQKLQNKLLKLRNSEKLLLQNGDLGIGSAPSNIALIKYWGKSKNYFQQPDNSSISLTLNNFIAKTTVTVLGRFFPPEHHPVYVPEHEFYLQENGFNKISVTSDKLNRFLKNILSPFALDIGLKIESENNFPTACGLASSAAGFAALSFAIDNLLNLKQHFTINERQYWLSQWARMGSGSALRSTSLNPDSKFVSWEIISPQNSIINFPSFHQNWNHLRHCVFVIDRGEKKISSSEGHQSAETSFFHKIRVNYINENFEAFKKALIDFDFKFISDFTENDALRMHAVMQTSIPSAKYLSQKTSDLISHFLDFRAKTGFRGFWTLDAGPNLHILYLKEERNKLLKFHKQAIKLLNQKIKIYE